MLLKTAWNWIAMITPEMPSETPLLRGRIRLIVTMRDKRIMEVKEKRETSRRSLRGAERMMGKKKGGSWGGEERAMQSVRKQRRKKEARESNCQEVQ